MLFLTLKNLTRLFCKANNLTLKGLVWLKCCNWVRGSTHANIWPSSKHQDYSKLQKNTIKKEAKQQRAGRTLAPEKQIRHNSISRGGLNEFAQPGVDLGPEDDCQGGKGVTVTSEGSVKDVREKWFIRICYKSFENFPFFVSTLLFAVCVLLRKSLAVWHP